MSEHEPGGGRAPADGAAGDQVTVAVQDGGRGDAKVTPTSWRYAGDHPALLKSVSQQDLLSWLQTE